MGRLESWSQLGLLLLAIAASCPPDAWCAAVAESVDAETSVLEISAAETMLLRAGEPAQLRTIVMPTGLSSHRYVESMTIDTGHAQLATVESAWIFADGLLDYLIDEDEQPGFEGSIDSRLTPLGERVLMSSPPGITEATREAWAWRLPPR